jgi:hypothetical protein
MSLVDRVRVASRFQRSIRIDTDLQDPAALDGFVCPKSSADVLLSMAHHVSQTGQAAFTWTGPYGSGKSSLALALSAVLGGKSSLRDEGARVIGKSVANALWKALPPLTRGWRILPVIGQRAATAEVIGEALVRDGYVEKGEVRRWTDHRVLAILTRLASENAKTRAGLIVVVDEMGKLLEGAGLDGHDIFLLQQLAEAAGRSGGRLIVVGILHQAFDEYAQRFTRDLRDEWMKVQGRFVDLAVSTVGDEQLDLLARAIQSDKNVRRPTFVAQTVAAVVRHSRPSAAPNLAANLDRCWPLHPIVACLLGPISRRRFGQNQRSLFGFLNSAEPFGFRDFLRDAEDGDLFTPDRLWDYLRSNLEPTILASPDGHRWSIAVEAIGRCEALGASPTHVQLLKTIALLDLFRERSGLEATSELLETSVHEKLPDGRVEECLRELQAWRVTIFRRHLGAHAVFAGSDFDVDQALVESSQGSRQEIDFRQLRTIAGLQPILAKRHYHETGALRWLDVDLVPLGELGSRVARDNVPRGAVGRFLLAVPTSNEAKGRAAALCRAAVDGGHRGLAVGLSGASWQVTDLAREVLAITRIEEDRPELSGDPVARREVTARLVDVRVRLEATLQTMVETAEWFTPHAAPHRYRHSDLNGLASDLADALYAEGPRITNELLNRAEPSSNAIAAQKALLKQMAEHEGEERVGIEGYPAEGGLFDSILLSSRLHRHTPEGWRFSLPDTGDDPCRVLPALRAATELLEQNSTRAVPMAEVYSVWQAPPFGVKRGLLPVLGVALLLSHRDRLAFYRDGIFQARFTSLEVDFLATDATSIQLRWMQIAEAPRRILSGLGAVVHEFHPEVSLAGMEPIDVARGLVSVFDHLRPWAKRTSRLSKAAMDIRTAFKQASDPNRFLFDDLPGLLRGRVEDPQSDSVAATIAWVRDGLRELTEAYPVMLARLQDLMLTELEVPNASPQALAELRARAENIRQLSGDFRLNAFVGRLSQFRGLEADMEGIASLATNKPARDWVDADLDQAFVEVADLSQKLIRIEAYARVRGRPDKRQAMAVVVGLDGRPTAVGGDFHVMDTDRSAIQDLIERVEEALVSSDGQRRNIILAALAEISARYLADDGDGRPLRAKPHLT